MTTVGVVGLGSVGGRVVRTLAASGRVEQLLVCDTDGARARKVQGEVQARGGPVVEVATLGGLVDDGLDVVVLCTPCGSHVETARRAVRQGVSVVSVSDRVSDVRALLALDRRARARGARVVVGAAFSPGLTCALAVVTAENMETVDEIHVAKDGTGGPACARQHHRALKRTAIDWRDGAWVRRPGGSGRELVWFPSPVDGADCYRAALAEALVLQSAFPEVSRITARRSATRQDRFTTWLPMLSPPPPEGGIGAVRVELRGRDHGARVVRVVGSACAPAVGAAAVAAAATVAVLDDADGSAGAGGIATSVDARVLLRSVQASGVSIVEFVGSGL